MSEQKRKPGRPASGITIQYRSISVPEKLFMELKSQALSTGISVGKLASERIKNGDLSEEFLKKYYKQDDEEGVDF